MISDKYSYNKVVKFGQEWKNILKNHILSGKRNIHELERLMGCKSGLTIGKYANEMGVFELLNSEMKIVENKDKRIRFNESLEDTYKTNVLSFLNKNSKCTRSELNKACSKQIAWLYRYRREWLESVQPKPLKKGAYSHKTPPCINWHQRDCDLYKNINIIIDENRKSEKPIRITDGLISKN